MVQPSVPDGRFFRWVPLLVGVALAAGCAARDEGVGPKPGAATGNPPVSASLDASTSPPPPAVPPPARDGGPAPPAPDAARPADAAGAGTCGRAAGACVNSSDCSKSRMDMQTKVAECGRRCLGAGACTASCMKDDLGITAGCADCWGAVVQCGRDKCFSQCIAGTDSPDCRACTSSAGCDATFATCSGL